MGSTKDAGNKQQIVVDRQKVCPFLLRVFFCEGRHHSLSEYTNKSRPPTTKELQIYTWYDATLNELMGLIRQLPGHGDKGLQFSYSVVFPEPSAPTYRMRHVGITIGGKRGPDDDKTLSACRLQIGDYLDVAILNMNDDITRLKSDQRAVKKNRRFNRGGYSGGNNVPARKFRRYDEIR